MMNKKNDELIAESIRIARGLLIDENKETYELINRILGDINKTNSQLKHPIK